jgi:hypothetical protein
MLCQILTKLTRLLPRQNRRGGLRARWAWVECSTMRSNGTSKCIAPGARILVCLPKTRSSACIALYCPRVQRATGLHSRHKTECLALESMTVLVGYGWRNTHTCAGSSSATPVEHVLAGPSAATEVSATNRRRRRIEWESVRSIVLVGVFQVQGENNFLSSIDSFCVASACLHHLSQKRKCPSKQSCLPICPGSRQAISGEGGQKSQ